MSGQVRQRPGAGRSEGVCVRGGRGQQRPVQKAGGDK